ncbi:MAG: hypothetical protein M0Q92_06005 [Methanoregula sp.]|jgi:hypothetical protein|nr:hypothetical protein [Methanoregula sp.]
MQYDNAEICPGCGCRINEPQKTGGVIGIDKIIAFFLIAIFIILCIIAFSFLNLTPEPAMEGTFTPAQSPKAMIPHDNSLSVIWNTMDDWRAWEHVASWSGKTVGSCTENGPWIVEGHGEYGTEVNLLAGSTESSIWRTFSDPSGKGWNTLTLVGLLSGSDVPAGRWMKIEINDNLVYEADATGQPPGNNNVFSIPVHFPQSPVVKVKISNGQKPMWGQIIRMEYYSLRLSNENYAGM